MFHTLIIIAIQKDINDGCVKCHVLPIKCIYQKSTFLLLLLPLNECLTFNSRQILYNNKNSIKINRPPKVSSDMLYKQERV